MTDRAARILAATAPGMTFEEFLKMSSNEKLFNIIDHAELDADVIEELEGYLEFVYKLTIQADETRTASTE